MTCEFSICILVNCIVINLSMTKIICLKIIFLNVIKSKEFYYPSIVFLSIYTIEPVYDKKNKDKCAEKNIQITHIVIMLAATCDFQQCGILTSVDSTEPVQPLFKLINSK